MRYFLRLINISFWLYIFSKSFRKKINTSDKKKFRTMRFRRVIFSLKLSDAGNALLIEPLELVVTSTWSRDLRRPIRD